MIELYKDGDTMSIVADCLNEDQFVDEFAELLSSAIENGSYDCDWEFQLCRWLRQFSDIVCSYRGYKADVDKKTVIVAGSRNPNSGDLVAVINPPRKVLEVPDKWVSPEEYDKEEANKNSQ
jgi:hypothetical protein